MLHEIRGEGLLDAMNTGQAAMTWRVESQIVRKFVRGFRSGNEGEEEHGRADGPSEPTRESSQTDGRIAATSRRWRRAADHRVRATQTCPYSFEHEPGD